MIDTATVQARLPDDGQEVGNPCFFCTVRSICEQFLCP